MRGCRVLPFEHDLKHHVEQIERWILFEIAAQQIQPFLDPSELFERGQQPLRHQRQIRRILAFDPLPGLDRGGGLADPRLQIAQQHVGTHAQAVVRHGFAEKWPCRLRPRLHDLVARQLAVEIGDLLLVRLAGDDFELLRRCRSLSASPSPARRSPAGT